MRSRMRLVYLTLPQDRLLIRMSKLMMTSTTTRNIASMDLSLTPARPLRSIWRTNDR